MSSSKNNPKHVAIIMDGNGRWAQARQWPRLMGHKKGFAVAREIVKTALNEGIAVLTLFTFSSENWGRPEEEIQALLRLLTLALRREIRSLDRAGIRLRLIGDRSRFPLSIQHNMRQAEEKTAQNTGMILCLAVGYGGRWDIIQAMHQVIHTASSLSALTVSELEQALSGALSLSDLPEPDLFIRTGGDMRLSNFLLWQLSYTELYFCEHFWPDFTADLFIQALSAYAERQRRFGCLTEGA